MTWTRHKYDTLNEVFVHPRWFPKVIPEHAFIGWLRVHNRLSTKDLMF